MPFFLDIDGVFYTFEDFADGLLRRGIVSILQDVDIAIKSDSGSSKLSVMAVVFFGRPPAWRMTSLRR